MSFYGLIKGNSPKMCILCVRVKINKRSFELEKVRSVCRLFSQGKEWGGGERGGGGS